jgi:eukaryotic translation initiation factor 2C
VLAQEIEPMKKAVTATYGKAGADIKWTVTVCSKRHHIRFFPKDGDNVAGDRNGNSLPGTLVERDVTHPFEYDFYLSSHSAIQGTARPVHYHVIKDEAQVDMTAFQNMIYKHCYQYARSTTPVSLYPAVYYAHLASNRARCHEARAASDAPTGGQKFEEAQQDAGVRARGGGGGSHAGGSSQSGSQMPPSEVTPLLPLASDIKDPTQLKAIRTSMWYI